MAVAVKANDLNSFACRARLTSRSHPLHSMMMVGSEAVGNNHRDIFALDILEAMPEHSFRSGVPERNSPSSICGDDRNAAGFGEAAYCVLQP